MRRAHCAPMVFSLVCRLSSQPSSLSLSGASDSGLAGLAQRESVLGELLLLSSLVVPSRLEAPELRDDRRENEAVRMTRDTTPALLCLVTAGGALAGSAVERLRRPKDAERARVVSAPVIFVPEANAGDATLRMVDRRTKRLSCWWRLQDRRASSVAGRHNERTKFSC